MSSYKRLYKPVGAGAKGRQSAHSSERGDGSERNCDVRDVEDWPPADVEKVDHCAASKPVIEVASRAAQRCSQTSLRQRSLEKITLIQDKEKDAEGREPDEQREGMGARHLILAPPGCEMADCKPPSDACRLPLGKACDDQRFRQPIHRKSENGRQEQRQLQFAFIYAVA